MMSVALVAPASTALSARWPRMSAAAVTGASESRHSRSMRSSTRPVPAESTVTTGMTRASRAMLQRSSRTGFHKPAVRMSGPQSQLDLVRPLPQPYRCYGVNAIEDQINALPRGRRLERDGTGIEHRRIAPVDVMHPPELSLIPIQVGIGDDAGRH